MRMPRARASSWETAARRFRAKHSRGFFDRFYRGDAARSEWTESSGLGLAIVQAIMRMHGGSASAQCSADGWIEFTLRFPAQA